ncbi:hypothetical protein DL770_009702 [Monosporascus sp. CRB-9-2]|nr:hypothetical protein DL770_009702 [Monosporascus sp. CRB-9-2]
MAAKAIDSAVTPRSDNDPTKRGIAANEKFCGVEADGQRGHDPSITDPSRTVNAKSKFLLGMITLALMSTIFLAALDVNIISVAIPRITAEFGSLNDVSWYGAAYSLARMALQPTFGRLYYLFPLRIVFSLSIILFCVGSVICATAPSSIALIVGRAVQGSGSSGLVSGALTLAAFVVSKQKLPLFISILSSNYAIASVLGPVVGGVLTESRLTWRFCFWINLHSYHLPAISALPIAVILSLFREPHREPTKAALWEKLASLDPIGTAILVGAVTCLILALQWGGITLPWGHPRVWGCLLGFALMVCLFVVLQVRYKEQCVQMPLPQRLVLRWLTSISRALIPMRILTQRTVAASCAISTFQMMSVNALTYYLPFYFQASRGLSPSASGLYILALAVPNPFFSIISGAAVTKWGIYVPWFIASGAVLMVGSGLLSTLDTASNVAQIIGYQFVASAGFGMGVQIPLVAMRNVLDDADLPLGNALYPFFQALGTSCGVALSQTIFLSALSSRLASRLPPAEVARILGSGDGSLSGDNVSSDLVPFIADSYSDAVQAAIYQSIASAGLAFLCGWVVEWKRLETGPEEREETS